MYRSDTDEIGLALLGLGTVGSGVVQLFEKNREAIETRAGVSLAIRRILVRDTSRPRRVAVAPELLSTNPAAVLDDPGVRIVVEVMGGTQPALDCITRALRAGKRVVTANKEIMADHGREVFEAAEEGGAEIFFEASVGGAIPIIRAVKHSLAADTVTRVVGILNGTTNYILTRMTEESRSFDEALREAREKGYAERDPSADIEGWDAARKLTVLASIAFGARVTTSEVKVEGIAGLTREDIEYGAELGMVLKLLGTCSLRNGRLEARVNPAFLPRRHPLAAVSGVYNAVMVEAEAAGPLIFYGQGAGSLPTASAVLGDVVEAARHLARSTTGPGCTCYRTVELLPADLVRGRYYLRLRVDDRAGVLARVAGILAREGISIQFVIQKRLSEQGAEIVFVTHESPEASVRRALRSLQRQDVVRETGAVLRVEDV